MGLVVMYMIIIYFFYRGPGEGALVCFFFPRFLFFPFYLFVCLFLCLFLPSLPFAPEFTYFTFLTMLQLNLSLPSPPRAEHMPLHHF